MMQASWADIQPSMTDLSDPTIDPRLLDTANTAPGLGEQ